MFDSREEQAICEKNGLHNCKNCPLVFDSSLGMCKANSHQTDDGQVHFDTDDYKKNVLGISETDFSGTFKIHVKKPGTFTISEEGLKQIVERELASKFPFVLGWCEEPEVEVEITSFETKGGNRPYFHAYKVV